jgi:hypothetical protein
LNNLKCYHGCNTDEDQRHIFEQCEVLKSNTEEKMYDLIFENEDKQKQAISTFMPIDEKRKSIKQGAHGIDVPLHLDNLPPGGNTARTQAVQAIDTIV